MGTFQTYLFVQAKRNSHGFREEGLFEKKKCVVDVKEAQSKGEWNVVLALAQTFDAANKKEYLKPPALKRNKGQK